MTSWAGILEGQAGVIHNRLANISYYGPDEKTEQYIRQAIKWLGDVRSMKAPRGRATRWKNNLVHEMERTLNHAIDVAMRRTPPMRNR